MHKVSRVIVKNLKVYRHSRVFYDETGNQVNRQGDFIHDYTLDIFKEMLFTCKGLEDIEKINQIVHQPSPNGGISVALDKECEKVIILSLAHNQYDKCSYTFRIGDKSATVPLTSGLRVIRDLIDQMLAK